MNYLEQWRLSLGPLKRFYLAGHSLGGFIAGHWAVKCHKEAKIKKLLLISPIGIRPAPNGEDPWDRFQYCKNTVEERGG